MTPSTNRVLKKGDAFPLTPWFGDLLPTGTTLHSANVRNRTLGIESPGGAIKHGLSATLERRYPLAIAISDGELVLKILPVAVRVYRLGLRNCREELFPRNDEHLRKLPVAAPAENNSITLLGQLTRVDTLEIEAPSFVVTHGLDEAAAVGDIHRLQPAVAVAKAQASKAAFLGVLDELLGPVVPHVVVMIG